MEMLSDVFGIISGGVNGIISVVSSLFRGFERYFEIFSG